MDGERRTEYLSVFALSRSNNCNKQALLYWSIVE